MKAQNILTTKLRTHRGIALVMALIITLVVFLMIGSTMYVIQNSTKISGAGKRYTSASEAADGAVEVMKNSINLIMYGEPINSLPLTNASGLLTAITLEGAANATTVNLNLAGTGMTNYTASITLERLKTKTIPGGRLEFARSAGGSGGTAIYFRISTVVEELGSHTKAENTVIYRFVG